MELALYLFLGLVPFVVFQVYRGFTRSTDELRTDNIQRIYAGQDRWPGSKESNDETRRKFEGIGLDLESSQCVEHIASFVGGEGALGVEELVELCESHGYKTENSSKDLVFLIHPNESTLLSMVFDRKTGELNDFLHEHGWKYEGWSIRGD
ncbi:MAG: hypothetical protein ACSHWS_12285 [Sulfitobacter sp.]